MMARLAGSIPTRGSLAWPGRPGKTKRQRRREMPEYKSVDMVVESGQSPPSERWICCPQCGAEGWLRIRVTKSCFPAELEIDAPCEHLAALLRGHERDKLVFAWDGEMEIKRWSVIPVGLVGMMGYQFAAPALLRVLGTMDDVWVATLPPTPEELEGLSPNEVAKLLESNLWVGFQTDEGVVYFHPLSP